MFENSPLSLWEEDWSEVQDYFERLRVRGVTDLAAWFDEHPESVLECVRRVRVLDVNQVTLDLLHARDKQELVRNLEEFFTEASLDTFRQELIALASGKRHFEAESVHRTLTGEVIDVAVYLSVVPDAGTSSPTVLVSLLDITKRKRAEAELRRERKTLREMLEFQEHERRLIGYEIHDGLAQQLAGAILLLQSFREQRSASLPSESWSTFDAACQLLDEAMAESRRLIDSLRPLALEEDGVLPAIEALVGQVRDRWGLEVEYVPDVRFDRLAPTIESALFRIVQEALTNARRHSRSKRVRIALSEEADRLRVEIRDWGTGFDPHGIPPGHFGLEGIRERARLLGGEATIESAPGQGTSIHVHLPLSWPNGT
ncbi:MAG: histidine kinase [Thermoguttaceae bacterium]|nr:histidine kinase [Thermoguttaceae bacterium]